MDDATELAHELKRVQRRLWALEEVLEDLAVNGTRHDIIPTIGGRIKRGGDIAGWYGYIESMDKYVRETAKRALKGE